jgi:hypothetical protein
LRCFFFVDGDASNWVQFKLGNTFQQLNARTRPNTHNPNIILHTGGQKESSPNEWLQKRGSGIWTLFWVRLMLFPKAWGPKAAPLFSKKSFFCEVFGQAIGFWRWSNFLHRHLAAGKQALHVNLDETGIRMHQVAVKGMLVNTAILEKRKAASLTQDVSGAMLRSSFTHVTIIL